MTKLVLFASETGEERDYVAIMEDDDDGYYGQPGYVEAGVYHLVESDDEEFPGAMGKKWRQW